MRIILQDRFKLLKEGKIANDVFVKEANMLYPSLIKASLHADDAISILKRRNIIFEDVNQNTSEKSFESEFQKFLLEVKNEAPKDAKAVEKQTSKQVEDSYTRGHNFKDNTNPNNISNQQFMNGMMAEYGDPKNDGKTYDQFVDIVVKNLMKDPLFYVKNSAFGIKGIGYTDETPGLKASKTDQMTKVELQNNSTALKSNSRDVTDKIKTNKIKDEMTTTPKSQRGIQKMDLPGKEKKIKVNENRITESEEYQTEETYRYNGKTYYVWVDDEHNRFIKVYGRKIQINENQELSSEDVSKLFDYHERTGMLPDGIDAEEFKRLLKKYNISRDNDKDLDPAGGYGLSSHIEENMDGDTTPKYFENLESAKKWAREFSSKEGVGVHVNKTKSGGYNVEDWFDSDSTVASYENGNQFNESINKPFSALFEENTPNEDKYQGEEFEIDEKIQDLIKHKIFMQEMGIDDLYPEEAYQYLEAMYSGEDIRDFHNKVYGGMELDETMNENLSLLDMASEYVATHGDTTPEELSRALNIPMDQAEYLLQSLSNEFPDELSISPSGERIYETNITENMDPLHVFRKYLLQENNKPITESKKVPVSKKIAEIEKNSVTIALESKINAIDEEITRRSNQIKMVEENEDLSELVDKTRMKELQKEIKLLEKQKDKYVKLYEKQTGKKKQEVVTDSTADAAEDSPIEEASEGDVAAQEELTKAIEGTKTAAEELDKVSQDSGLVEEIQPTEDELTAMKSELESYIDMVGDFEEAVEMYLNFHPEHAKYKTMLRQLAEPMF